MNSAIYIYILNINVIQFKMTFEDSTLIPLTIEEPKFLETFGARGTQRSF